MLLSNTFLFIHIDKSAGTSIQKVLEARIRPRTHSRWRRRLAWLGPVNRLGSYRVMEFPEHGHASLVKSCLPGDIYAGLFKFAFVRNPWDRLVSRYAQLLRTEKSPRYQAKAEKGFEAYLEWEIRRNKSHQHPYVCGADGKLIVDFIGYFERLDEDFSKVCQRLQFDDTLPKSNISKHDSYQSYYTPATRAMVAEHCRRDIELFGYDFDGIAATGGRS